jgi:ketosteroid isomerase-like protein
MVVKPIEVVRRAVETWGRGDVEGFIAMFAPDSEVTFRPDVPEPGPFHGPEQLREWAEGFRQAWESQSLEIVASEVSGDQVFVVIRLTSHGAGSGIDNVADFAFVFTVRNGLIARWRGFVEADEARAAAGLST